MSLSPVNVHSGLGFELGSAWEGLPRALRFTLCLILLHSTMVVSLRLVNANTGTHRRWICCVELLCATRDVSH